MKKITQEKLKEILEKHKKWLLGEDGGERADLSYMDLSCMNLKNENLECANLEGAVLQGANLEGAVLQAANLEGAVLQAACFRDANLEDARLPDADLRGAKLRYADLRNADLQGADLNTADLRDADLAGADIDYSCLPLWCGSLSAHFDDRQLRQIAYHLVKAGLHSKNASPETKRELAKLIDFANEFHRADECGKIKLEEEK